MNNKHYIFLDIDGVLNNRQYTKLKCTQSDKKLSIREVFDPSSIKLMNKIIEEYNPYIVISSTWRYQGIEKVQDTLANVGFEGIIRSKTPFISDAPRGWEIRKWISDHEYYDKGNVESYVIIDDDSDMMYNQRYNFVQTKFDVGFQEESYEQTIKILSK